MGYPVQTGAPTVVMNGLTYAIGAFLNESIVSAYTIGIYQNDPTNGWTSVSQTVSYTNSGDTLAAVQAKGGIAPYMTWLCTQINQWFATLFPATTPTPAPTEPTTDAAAQAAISGGVNALKITAVNGTPVASVA